MIKIDKYRNLLNQTFTKAGRLNFYAVDKIDDLQKISEDSIEIIGCRAYVIENGKFYIMGSNKLLIDISEYSTKNINTVTFTVTFVLYFY